MWPARFWNDSRSLSDLKARNGRPAWPGALFVWWTAIRPRTLGIALAPVALGTALAIADGASINGLRLLATLFCALLIQIGTNLHNDAADFERGTDRPQRQGPLRVTLAGWRSAAAVKRGAFTCFALALLLGIYLTAVGGGLILAIGLASLSSGWAYSGGTRPISHTAFGEAFVLVFFGVLAVAGSHWLQSRNLSGLDLLAGIAVGAPAAAVLLVNNSRDLESDLLGGRRTLAAILGWRASRAFFAFLLLVPAPLLGAIALAGLPGVLLGGLCLPQAVVLIGRFTPAASGEELNALLADTARNGCLTGLLAAAGLVLGLAWPQVSLNLR